MFSLAVAVRMLGTVVGSAVLAASSASAALGVTPDPLPEPATSGQAIAECIAGVNADDQAAKAKCAGVPDPTPTQTDSAALCIAGLSSSLPAEQYAKGHADCLNQTFTSPRTTRSASAHRAVARLGDPTTEGQALADCIAEDAVGDTADGHAICGSLPAVTLPQTVAVDTCVLAADPLGDATALDYAGRLGNCLTKTFG